MTDKVFRFGPCEVHVARREVKVDGQQRGIEPRAFNLLAYLLEQRHRVVSKDELLDKIWPGEVVSVGSIARAVLKARQALGDDDESVFIKTVPRVGYRFVAPLSPGNPLVPGRGDGGLRGGERATSVALLPFENLTGERELDWVELGLMTLVNNALANATRLAPISTPSLLTALGSLPAKAGREARSAAVQRLTGAQHVVEVSISREAAGYRLDSRVLTLPTTPAHTLYDEEPTALGQRLARQLPVILLPDTQAATSVGFDLADPLANQAFARAEQAAAEQKWQPAINLLKVVLDLAPDSHAVRLEYLRALAAFGDVEAHAVASQLLAQAEADNDMLLAAAVHQAIGRAHLNWAALDPAKFHLEQALLLAAGRQTPDWTAQTLLLAASVAVHERNFAVAEDHLDRVERLCEQSGNRIFPLARINMQAIIAASTGDLSRSLRLSREVIHRGRAQRVYRYFMDACGNAALDCVALGMLKDAAAHGEEGFATALLLDDRAKACDLAEVLCRIYRDSRAPEASARVLAALSPRAVGLTAIAQEAWLGARGQHAAGTGDHAGAASYFRESIAMLRTTKNSLQEHETIPWLMASLIRSRNLDEVTKEFKRVAHPPYTEDEELQTALLHCRALLAHAGGDAQTALSWLQEVVRTAQPGFWHACACVDAAWLLAESGRAAEARALLGRLDEWFREHPMAIATDARVKHAARDLTGACDAHRRHVAALGSALPHYYRQLGEAYACHAAALGGVPCMLLAPIPCLPSSL
ncbi:MAG: transcriptional regulator [Burkholderiales bacterium]